MKIMTASCRHGLAWAQAKCRAALQTAALGAVMVIAACGGGGGQPTPPAGSLFTTSYTPAPSSVVRTDPVFMLEFNVALDPATATSAHVSLSSDTGPVPADIVVSQKSLTVKPRVRLRLLSNYHLLVTTGLKGAAGETLGQNFQVSVSTPRAVFDGRTIVPEADLLGGSEPDPMMAIADLNSDGRKDLATISSLETDPYASGYTMRLYRQAPDGSFALTQRIHRSLGQVSQSVDFPAFEAIDLDQDGVQELVVVENQPREDASKVSEWELSGLRVFRRGSDGLYRESTYIRTAYVRNVQMGDVDGDGYADLVGVRDFDPDGQIYGFRDSGFQVMLSRPTGLQLQAPVVGLQQLVDTIQLIDLNRDGDLDLMITQRPGVLVYSGNGRGEFSHDVARSTMMSPLCTSYCRRPIAVDLNEDGWPDFPAELRSEPLWISRADGTYVTQPSQALPGLGGGLAPTAGDFDKDGHQDLFWFFGSPLSPTSYMPLFGTGTGLIELSPADYFAGYGGGSLADDAKRVVDMDGDGYLDVLVSEHNSGVVLLRQVPD